MKTIILSCSPIHRSGIWIEYRGDGLFPVFYVWDLSWGDVKNGNVWAAGTGSSKTSSLAALEPGWGALEFRTISSSAYPWPLWMAWLPLSMKASEELISYLAFQGTKQYCPDVALVTQPQKSLRGMSAILRQSITSCGTISNMMLPRCTAPIHGACEHDQISFHHHIMLHGTIDLNIENYPRGSGLIPRASKGRETPLADRKRASHRHKQWSARLPDQLKAFKK